MELLPLAASLGIIALFLASAATARAENWVEVGHADAGTSAEATVYVDTDSIVPAGARIKFLQRSIPLAPHFAAGKRIAQNVAVQEVDCHTGVRFIQSAVSYDETGAIIGTFQTRSGLMEPTSQGVGAEGDIAARFVCERSPFVS